MVAPGSAAAAPGCLSPDAPSRACEGATGALLERAAAITAPLGAEELAAGKPAVVGPFCEALTTPADGPGSYDQAEQLYRQSEDLLKQTQRQATASAELLTKAVLLSCSASFAIPRDDALGAWNEYNIGRASFLLGRASGRPAALKIGLLALSAAADLFSPSDEGWGWSRYDAGRSAHELWRHEGSEFYLARSVEALRQVVGNPALPAELVAYAKLELSDALLDTYKRTGKEEVLAEASQYLQSIEHQEGFKDAVQAVLGRLGVARHNNAGRPLEAPE